MSTPRAQERPSRWRRPERIRRDLEALGLLSAIGVASALLLLPRGDDGLIGLPELSAGDVAPRTVKSSRAYSVVDPALTAQTRERARAAVRPVFDHLLGLAEGPKQRLAEALEAAFARPAPEARGEVFGRHLGAETRTDLLVPLLRMSEPTVILDAGSMLLDELFALPMVSEPRRLDALAWVTVRSIDADGQTTQERELAPAELDALGPNQARARVDALAAERLLHLPDPARRALTRVVKTLLTPNLVPNAQETLRRRRLAWLSVKPSVVLVARGERIIRAGERVTERDLLLLRELARLESPQARLQSGLGSALLGLLLAGFAYRAACAGYRHRRPKQRDLVFLASAFGAFLLLGWLGYKAVDWLADVEPLGPLGVEGYRFVLPMAAVTILVRLAAGPVVATVAALVSGLLAGWMMDGDLDFAAYTAAGALAAATTDPAAKRVVLSAGIRAGLAQAAVVVGLLLLAAELEPETAILQVLVALGSGAMAAALARVGVPAVETLFGYTTPSGLAAFADAEHPLLRELLVEVPGTYHHSLHVGALAEAGAQAIGSDRLLARVGGYFHDVGRLRRGSEPVDGGRGLPSRPRSLGADRALPLGIEHSEGRAEAMTPGGRRRAAAKLAGLHRFPPELAQILAEQPHESARSMDDEERRPRPRSKASALVFLADWVEDALRGREGELEDRAALEQVVRERVRAAVGTRLLDEADLELRELAAVAAAFADTLAPRFLAPAGTGSGAFRIAKPPPGAPS